MMVPALAEQHAAHMARLARMGGAPSPQIARPPLAAAPVEPPPEAPLLGGKVRTGLAWAPIEVETLLDMAAAKFSARAIATKLRRSTDSVQAKARKLGIILYLRPSREFVTPLRGEEITRLYKLHVDLNRSSNDRVRGIMQICAGRYGISVMDILSDSRAEMILKARQQAMWLAAKETGLSYPAIGKLFGRDHTTVLHAVRRENTRTGENVRSAGVVRS